MREASARRLATRGLRVLVTAAIAGACGGCQTAEFATVTPEVHQLVLNGAQISYVEQGERETVVSVHGIALDWRSWENVRPYIAQRYRFVAYSRRPHAPNRWPDDVATYGIVQHVQDLQRSAPDVR